MATEAQQPLKITLEAHGDLSAAQYCFVKVESGGQVVICSAATDEPIGVLQNNPNAQGKACEIVVVGLTKVVVTDGSAGTAFTTPSDGVATDSAGHAQKATATGMGSAFVQGTKARVGKVANATVNDAGVGHTYPAASTVTRILVNCIAPVPAT